MILLSYVRKARDKRRDANPTTEVPPIKHANGIVKRMQCKSYIKPGWTSDFAVGKSFHVQ
jgi:hypothetical protein